jgi:integrase
MTPRKASLRVAHSRTCRNPNATSLASLKRCTCQPSYYVFHRDRNGVPIKSERVKTKRTAETILRRVQGNLDEGRAGIVRKPKIEFGAWADEYEEILENRVDRGDLKPRTRDGYLQTLERARDAFGNAHLDEISPSELRKFDAQGDIQPASRLRYLRELSACLQAAVADGKLDANPVPAFTKRLGIKKPKRGKAPFERAELARIWLELRKLDERVYLYVSRFSAETGLRLRELVGLDWSNVSLSDRTVLVAEQYQERYGALSPKGNRIRTIYLTRQATRTLEQWAAISRARGDGPVFPHPRTAGRLSAQVVQDRFSDAMTAAGIPKLHPTMRDEVSGKQLPRTFHSLRFTCAMLMRYRGYNPVLVQETVGHADAALTHELYGRPSPALLAEAARNPG